MATEVIERAQPATTPTVAERPRVPRWARAAVPGLGLVGVLGTVVVGLTIAVNALAGPSFVTSGVRAFETWPAGFLNHLGGRAMLAEDYGPLTVWMFGFYALALACSARLELRAVVIAVAVLHVAFLLTPIIESKDVFNYLDYARLQVLHGMNPYQHPPHDLHDKLLPLVGWAAWKSPYGPVYTLLSYVAAPLGIGGGLWALKAISTAAAAGCLALVVKLARRLGRPPAVALVLVGLNPAWLVWGVGGAHNDFLMILLELVALLLLVDRRDGAAGAVAMLAAGIKVPALLLVPMVVLAARDRRRALIGAAGALAFLALLSLVAFGGFEPLTAFRVQNAGLFTNRSLLGYLARFFSQPLLTNDLAKPAVDVFAPVALACVAWAWRDRRAAIAAFAWGTAALILALTWEFPWYVAWLLPFAALVRDWKIKAAAFAFTAVLLVAYVPLDFFLA